MPNRIIRGDLLDSERYWSVTIEARQLFIHLLLLADDLGCISLAPVFIRRRCFDEAPSQNKVDKLIEQLVDADLIRAYTADGVRFAFIPRFRQRLQRMTLKHPPPPEALVKGDDDALEKFIKIKGASTVSTDGALMRSGSPTTEVKGREVNQREVEVLPALKSAKVWAEELGIKRMPAEGEGAFQVRVATAVARHKTATQE